MWNDSTSAWNNVYSYGMAYAFQHCSSLASVDVSVGGYINWNGLNTAFGRTALTSAPTLNNITMVGERGCNEMFGFCLNLSSAPDIPDVSLAGKQGFRYIYAGCTGLTAAPEIRCSKTGEGILYGAFQNCTNLVKPPSTISATMAKQACYGMFNGCTALTASPYLAAPTMVDSCY